jgi:F0F1-type ATP synthase delta subunit
LKSVSLQYANALADVALEQGVADTVTEQLTGFGALYAESAELRNFCPARRLRGKRSIG